MPKQTHFDVASLSIVKPGMDEALSIVAARLDQYLGAPELNATALSEVRAELHRIHGVLSMIGLDGVAVYCVEIERVLAELAAHPRLASPLYRSVLQLALEGMTDYLNALMQGADNATLRLFPKYEAMQHLRGMEMAFEQDLFFPDLTVSLPGEILNVAQPGHTATTIKAAHSQYQRGLIQCLQGNDVAGALPVMQPAIETILSCAPQHERAYWWVANGLLDCVRLDGLPPEVNVRKLLGRIERQIRAIGKASDVRQTMNEMLYLIGRSRATSRRADQIIQHFALERYLPGQSALTAAEERQMLTELRDQMQEAEENWEHCVAGDGEACGRFVEYMEKVARQSDKLARNAPNPLIRKIEALSTYLRDPEYARLIGEDVAMALMLWRSGMSQYETLDARFQEQSRILSDQLDAAMSQQPEDVQRISELISLYNQTEQGQVTTTLANEMLANLQLVEQGLNAFFGDEAKRDELNGLPKLLTQIHGGLNMLSLAQAEQLLLEIKKRVVQFVAGTAVPKLSDTQALASAVSALHEYLQHLTHGQKHHTIALLAAYNELAGPSPEIPAGTGALPVVQAEAPRPSAEDMELLEIFLEEANEVLGIMRDNIEICQLHPENLEPLTTIRRGFHTLKGSGRMVGLNELGEVALAAERAMNKCVQDKKPATPGILQFIDDAVQAFNRWVCELGSQGYASIEAAGLVERAVQIENGIEPGAAVSAKAPEITPVHLAASAELPEIAEHETALPEQADDEQEYEEPDSVLIGDISLSPTLFRIASEEASQNVSALHRHFVAMRAGHPPQVSYDFMRAAHTLAGICRSLGFMAVVELAAALEGWLQAHIDRPVSISAEQLHMLDQVIAALDDMVQRLCDRQMPHKCNELVQQVLGDKDKVISEIEAALKAVSSGQAVAGEPLAPSGEHAAIEAKLLAEARMTSAPVRERKAVVRDDVDAQLLPVFIDEADELCPKIGGCLRALREEPGHAPLLQLLNRLLHTLKGSARMTGAMRIGEITHGMEDRLLTGARDGVWDELEGDLDKINALLEELRSGKPLVQAVTEDVTEADRGLPSGVLHGSMLRVRADVVDRLVNQAGEISVARSRMEAELRAFKDGLLELTGSVMRLRKQLREVEIQAESQMQARVSLASDSNEQFDPLEFDRFTRLQELTRFMNESVHDVQTVQQALLKNIDETNSAIFAQARLNRDLQQNLMSVRMVPFGSMSERLYRTVRQTAKDMNKRANLELTGGSVELDRSVLEKMTAPFEHLLRNAIAHGLENEQVRIDSGKDAIGEVRLSLRQESNEVVFELSDNGRGLDFAALRKQAVAKGLLESSDDFVSDDQLAQLIFMSGISTAGEVTEVAGRGIGMDVVRSEITALGGRIDVSSRAGLGTQFTIHLPLTLAVTQVLMVRAGDVTYAVPSTMVEQVRQVKPAELEALYAEHKVEWQDKTYPFHYLPMLLGDDECKPASLPHNPLLLLRSGNQRIALHVDELLGNREAVVKNIGPQLSRMPGIAGATVMGNGQVVLILNPVQMTQRIAAVARKTRRTEPVVPRVQPLVMVVDDSLTVRKITTRLLVRAGYQVVTAKDGVDALEQLAELNPSVMLLDVEMPRMDGFELTKLLRRDEKTRNLPIIMITSRTADKHRDFAMQLGVNVYLGKPFQEEELLTHIAGFVSVPATD